MKTPKLLFGFAGQPLISPNVWTLVSSAQMSWWNGAGLRSTTVAVARDELPFQGPMDEIVSGIQAAATELRVVTSCDAPFLNPASIRLRPLRAVYHRLVLP